MLQSRCLSLEQPTKNYNRRRLILLHGWRPGQVWVATIIRARLLSRSEETENSTVPSAVKKAYLAMFLELMIHDPIMHWASAHNKNYSRRSAANCHFVDFFSFPSFANTRASFKKHRLERKKTGSLLARNLQAVAKRKGAGIPWKQRLSAKEHSRHNILARRQEG